jgi:hypothetical protein
MRMVKSSLLIATLFFGSASLVSAQAGSAVNLRSDRLQLQRRQWQEQQDRNLLALDRHKRANDRKIREDEAQIRHDKHAIKDLRADIDRDRRMRRRFRQW